MTAITKIIEPSVTGFLVGDTHEMAEAISAADKIDRARCRAIARRRFPLRRMVERYFRYYDQLARSAYIHRRAGSPAIVQ